MNDNEIKPKNSTRRLIAGILLIVGAAILIIQSLGVLGGYAMATVTLGMFAGFLGLLLAAAMIIQGIYYIKTKCAYKNKDFEWAWFWAYGILAVIIFGSNAPRYFSDIGNVWPIVVIVLWILGYRWGQDQKDLIDKQKSKDKDQPQAVKTTKQDTADEIMKYKKLLDANAITQEEYDKKKAELLNK